MSNFRVRAREIKAAGEAERGNFNPTGVPLRLYNYWLETSDSDKAFDIKTGRRRENFCHFWRVVLFWAPLFWAVQKVTQFAASKIGLISILVLLVGSVVGLSIVFDGFRVGFGVVLAVGAAFAALFGLAFAFDSYVPRNIQRIIGRVVFGTFVVTVSAGLLAALVVFIMDTGWMGVAGIIGTLVTIGVLVAFFAGLSQFISGRRALKAEKHRKALEAYYSGKGPNPNVKPVLDPGRISKFCSGMADFIVLIVQIVRVKKWKICPMVDING